MQNIAFAWCSTDADNLGGLHDEQIHVVENSGSDSTVSQLSSPDQKLSSTPFYLHVNVRISFRRGGFNAIVGPTGSGKTALLLALLGEMYATPLTSDSTSWVSLPRSGGIAYAAQETWVTNETIRVCFALKGAVDL